MSASTFYLQKEINQQRLLIKQYELKDKLGSSLSITNQIPTLLNLTSGLGGKSTSSKKQSVNSDTWIGKSVILLDTFQQAMRIGRRLQKLFQKNEE